MVRLHHICLALKFTSMGGSYETRRKGIGFLKEAAARLRKVIARFRSIVKFLKFLWSFINCNSDSANGKKTI